MMAAHIERAPALFGALGNMTWDRHKADHAIGPEPVDEAVDQPIGRSARAMATAEQAHTTRPLIQRALALLDPLGPACREGETIDPETGIEVPQTLDQEASDMSAVVGRHLGPEPDRSDRTVASIAHESEPAGAEPGIGQLPRESQGETRDRLLDAGARDQRIRKQQARDVNRRLDEGDEYLLTPAERLIEPREHRARKSRDTAGSPCAPARIRVSKALFERGARHRIERADPTQTQSFEEQDGRRIEPQTLDRERRESLCRGIRSSDRDPTGPGPGPWLGARRATPLDACRSTTISSERTSRTEGRGETDMSGEPEPREPPSEIEGKRGLATEEMGSASDVDPEAIGTEDVAGRAVAAGPEGEADERACVGREIGGRRQQPWECGTGIGKCLSATETGAARRTVDGMECEPARPRLDESERPPLTRLRPHVAASLSPLLSHRLAAQPLDRPLGKPDENETRHETTPECGPHPVRGVA